LSADSHVAKSVPAVLSSSTRIGAGKPSLTVLRCDLQTSNPPFVPAAARVDEK
jgi:hypothetical protein